MPSLDDSRALERLVAAMPYARYLNVAFESRGDEMTAILPYSERLIGNPVRPALHGGATGAFLEIAAIAELFRVALWRRDAAEEHPLPLTIDFTVDYLRTGLPRDAFALARIDRVGRRFASVHVTAWQEARDRAFAQAIGHFLMPSSDG